MLPASGAANQNPRRLPVKRYTVSFTQFVWLWNYQQKQTTPKIHINMSRWLDNGTKNNKRRMLLLAFRNSGKSTIIGLYSAWLILQNPNLRILVLAGDFDLAKKMVKNTRAIISQHVLTKQMLIKRGDQWAADQFTVQRTSVLRDPSMLAKGIESNITGARADLLICDDVEVPNTCGTRMGRSRLRARIEEARYVLTPDGTHVVIGTPHTLYSIYSNDSDISEHGARPVLHGYHRLELPIVSSSGESNWPERFPLERIEALRRETGPAKFSSQMLLEPSNAESGRLRVDNIRFYDAELEYKEGNGESILLIEGNRLISVSCWWDPAFGLSTGGHSSVITAVFTDTNGNYWLHRAAYLRHDPKLTSQTDEATQLCDQVVEFAHNLFVPAVTIETNGIGRFLPGLLRQSFRRKGLPGVVREHVSTQNKELRIIDALDAVLAAGRLFAHRSILQTPLIGEFREWYPGSGGRDDGLDAVAGCLLTEPVRLPRSLQHAPIGARREWRPAHSVLRAESDFFV